MHKFKVKKIARIRNHLLPALLVVEEELQVAAHPLDPGDLPEQHKWSFNSGGAVQTRLQKYYGSICDATPSQ